MSMTLVFPAITPEAKRYIHSSIESGGEVVCAASVSASEPLPGGLDLHHLPSIYDPAFGAAFEALVQSASVSRIYCPVASVHRFMRTFLQSRTPVIKLIGESPIARQMSAHYALVADANAIKSFVDVCTNGNSRLSTIDVAGVLKQTRVIYGESNDDKVAAMLAVAASAPAGDVIELGSLMGRSAFVLSYLCRRYRIGALLTVDPWTPFNAVQHDSPLAFQGMVDEWDFDVLKDGFFINMVPFCADNHAHLRLPAEHASRHYLSGEALPNAMGDVVPFTRRISMIHIDGNHDFDAVDMDCRLWLPSLVPGGWLILDDYLWAHGDGPRRVGDRLLADAAHHISTAFVAGQALFVQLRNSPDATLAGTGSSRP